MTFRHVIPPPIALDSLSSAILRRQAKNRFYESTHFIQPRRILRFCLCDQPFPIRFLLFLPKNSHERSAKQCLKFGVVLCWF